MWTCNVANPGSAVVWFHLLRPTAQRADVTAKTLPVDPFDLVIFGGTGDLAMRKLLPGLLRRYADGQIREETRIIGVARDGQSAADYRSKVGDALIRLAAGDDALKATI